MKRLGYIWLLAAWLAGFTCWAQDRSLSSASHGATAQERLLMEQIDQLASAGQFTEALANLRRLVDNSQGRLIEAGAPAQASTLSLQKHIPISRWAHERMHAWSQVAKVPIDQALGSEGQQAERALLSAGLNPSEIQRVLDRYPLATAGIPARLMLCDLYMDRGWSTAARQVLDVPELALRARPTQPSNIGGLPWPAAWPHLRGRDQVKELINQSWQAITSTLDGDADQLKVELLNRATSLSALDATDQEFTDTLQWAQAMGESLAPKSQAQLNASLDAAKILHTSRRQEQQRRPLTTITFAGNGLRSGYVSTHAIDNPVAADQPSSVRELGSWPKWTRQVERMTGASDRNPASKPPVGENALSLLPYHPLISDGRVYVHELTRVMAYDLRDGKSWPKTEPALPLFDSGLTAASYLPFGYPFVGAPRGTLTIHRDSLYARMGPPVTGWFGKAPSNEARSLSYLIALDLQRQGSMQPGFPVYLPADEFPNSEFEGAPLISGEQLLACIATRDNVNLRRSLIAIDARTGQIQWRSPVLASGMVSGSEQFSLIAHQLVTSAGGRAFINTNLGAIACVNQATGQIVWLARYKRSTPASEEAYPKPDRYRYRDLTPCMVVGTQLICAPQDCPEIFALDITSGELLWSTDGEQVDDATQLLGVAGQSLVVAGDRIYWLECNSGKVQAAFPAGSLGEVANALPSPRGYGRGAIDGQSVYWPTASEVFVFDADQSGSRDSSPQIRARMRLDTRGGEGGNLVLFRDGLLVAGTSRLFVFSQ